MYSKISIQIFGILDSFPYICIIKITFFHNLSQSSIFFQSTRYLLTKASSMKWRFDKDKVEDTFKGVDSDIDRVKLQRMADEEGIQINWDFFDEMVSQSVFEEEENDSTSREPNKTKETQPKYVYTTDGNFIKSFETTRECAEYFGIAPEAVCQYSRTEKPYLKLGIIIANNPKKVKSDKAKYSKLSNHNLEYQMLLKWKEQASNEE